MFSPAAGYLIRPARSDDEDLEALRIFGHCLYHYPMEDLAKSRTRDSLADTWHLRCAKRPGETMLLTRKGLNDDGHTIVGATRITPDPNGDRDDAGEPVNWSITCIMPDHRGKGLSKALREAAIAATKVRTIRSRVKADNPKSWRVAEKMGYQHERDDGKERIYVLKLDKQRKTAAEEVVRLISEECKPVGGDVIQRTRTELLRTGQPAQGEGKVAMQIWGLGKAADFDRPRTTDPSVDAHRELNAVTAGPTHDSGAQRPERTMSAMKTAGDYPDQPLRREQRIRNRGDHDRPTEPNEADYREVELVRDASRAEAAVRGGREGDEAQEKVAMLIPDDLIKTAGVGDTLKSVFWDNPVGRGATIGAGTGGILSLLFGKDGPWHERLAGGVGEGALLGAGGGALYGVGDISGRATGREAEKAKAKELLDAYFDPGGSPAWREGVRQGINQRYGLNKTGSDMSYDIPDDLIKTAKTDHAAGVPEKGVTKGQKVPDGGEPSYSSSEGPNAYTKQLVEVGGDIPDELVEDAITGG